MNDPSCNAQGSLGCTFEQPVSNVQWIESLFKSQGSGAFKASTAISISRWVKESLACVLVSRDTISLFFLSQLCWEDSGDWWGIRQARHHWILKKGVAQTSTSSLVQAGITEIYYQALCVWLGEACLRNTPDTTWVLSFWVLTALSYSHR